MPASLERFKLVQTMQTKKGPRRGRVPSTPAVSEVAWQR